MENQLIQFEIGDLVECKLYNLVFLGLVLAKSKNNIALGDKPGYVVYKFDTCDKSFYYTSEMRLLSR